MTSVDRYLGRRFHPRTYNCAHLVCDVWRDLKGNELGETLSGFLCAPRERKAVRADLRRIQFINQPVSPCVVLMQAPNKQTHVGVWLRGRVLHITERGVQFVPLYLASMGFKRIRFFTC